MDNFKDMLVEFKNSVELFAELFIFIGVDVHGKSFRAFEARVLRAHADTPRTATFILQ